MIKTFNQLKECNKNYFTKENKIFFNDINYKVLQSEKSKTSYLIQHTYKFIGKHSINFDGIKNSVYVIKPVTTKGDILESVAEFKELSEVKTFLKEV
tara:strand:+ start:1089 stop:1379 length:291 start_codon:yes stop_codon:yes gene_type:complete